jgi:hypothetical protein
VFENDDLYLAILTVEVVVSLSDGDQGGDKVVTRSVLVVESVLSEPMSQRVDTEGGLQGKSAVVSTIIQRCRRSSTVLTW